MSTNLSTQAELDVVIVAKNESRRLPSALKALAEQDYPSERLQVYVVDNDSSDCTAELARNHGAIVIHHSGTVASARNAGIKAGKAEIVAFIDAHCVIGQGWVREVVTAFNSPDIGGCMGPIVQSCDHALVQTLMRDSIFADSESLLSHTLKATTVPYPWMPTGNCAYRRDALAYAGLFNEKLNFCEDTDMSWRVIFSGYLLKYIPQASVIHYESASLLQYLRKQFNYGRGAAELANLYGFNGSRSDARRGSLGRRLLGFCHNLGYRFGRLASRLHRRSSDFRPPDVQPSLRPSFEWQTDRWLCISPHVIYWFPAAECSVAVHGKERFSFDGIGDILFRNLCRGKSRQASVSEIGMRYDQNTVEIARDLDDFVEDLISRQIVKVAVSAR